MALGNRVERREAFKLISKGYKAEAYMAGVGRWAVHCGLWTVDCGLLVAGGSRGDGPMV